ncbi:MAG: hypothetical protein MRK00_06615 [Nitrosomonas sp.]|nr:hypothetical protein [Nitrosomonas sp.]
MKVLILFFVILSIVGCQSEKNDHENIIEKVEREIKEDIISHVEDKLIFSNPKPCGKNTPNPHCRLDEINNPVVANELISQAKKANLKDVTIVVLIDSEGNSSQLLLDIEQSNKKGNKFIVKRENLQPGQDPTPTNEYNATAMIIPFVKNPNCVRWLYGGYNGPQGGSQYTDYCLIWK